VPEAAVWRQQALCDRCVLAVAVAAVAAAVAAAGGPLTLVHSGAGCSLDEAAVPSL
jgi:hypothetical protein